jgi:putative membrane protein
MMKTISKYFPHFLLAVYAIEWTVLAIAPYDRAVWKAENYPIMAIVVLLVFLYVRGVRFSNLGYALASVLIFWHTIGGHYTFERVPFDFFTNLFGWERNNFDRIGHFSVGFYAFLFMEYFVMSKAITKKWVAYLSAFTVIGSVAAFYEIVEWVYAVKEGGEAGLAFLGSQGDIWDAQKDMALDMLGAVAALLIFFVREKVQKVLTKKR